MKLWHLYAAKNSKDDLWGYDCAYGFVVAAETEDEAREIAASKAGCEGANTWRQPWNTVCEELRAENEKPGVILRDFVAG